MKLIPAIAFILLIAAMLTWAVAAWWQERRRRGGLARLGGPLGLRLSAGDAGDLPELYFHLHLFTQGHSRLVRNILQGRLDGAAVRMFDYQYETGSGVHRRTHRWQVAVAQSGYRFPGLLVQPTGRHDPLEELFGFDEVAFTTEPFARTFHVASQDRQFAYQMLHPRLIDLLLTEPAMTLEARDETLAAYRPGPLGPAEAIAMLRSLGRVLELMPRQLGQELAAPAE